MGKPFNKSNFEIIKQNKANPTLYQDLTQARQFLREPQNLVVLYLQAARSPGPSLDV